VNLTSMRFRPLALSALALLLAAPALAAPPAPAGWVPQPPTIAFAGGVKLDLPLQSFVTGYALTITGPEQVTCKSVDIQIHVSEAGSLMTGFLVIPTFCADVYGTPAWTLDVVQDQPLDSDGRSDIRADVRIDAKKKKGKKIAYTVELEANTYAPTPSSATVTGKAGKTVAAVLERVAPVPYVPEP